MDRSKLDTILLTLRVEMLELMVFRLTVFMRTSGLTTATSTAVQSAVKSTVSELETYARGLEISAHSDPQMALLPPEIRALFADEFRELLERMKGRLHELYPFA